MTNREKIEQLRGKFVRKVAFVYDTNIRVDILGYENYPEPTHWELIVNNKSVSGWTDLEYVFSTAVSLGAIDSDTANQLEIEASFVQEAIQNRLPNSKW